MRITIATGPWLPVPPLAGGSVNRRWQGLAEEFAVRGHEVTIFCRSYEGQPPQETLRGVRYLRRGGAAQSTNIYRDLLKDAIYAALATPHLPSGDILVINDFWLPVFASWRPAVGKLVLNCARVPKGQYWLYRRAHRFAAVSQAIADEIVRQHPPAAPRTRVIPNPTDTKVFSPPSSPRSHGESILILYVGRIHPEKGLELLVPAFRWLWQQDSRVRLRIVGPAKESQGGGGDAFLARLRSLADSLPIEFWAPIFEIDRLAELYREADLFCYPSIAEKGEAFGVAPLEAMSTGLVPVVSDLACFRDFIGDRVTGYYFNHRGDNPARTLAETLHEALENPEQLQQMSERAVRQAQNFSYSTVADRYLDDFERAIAQN